MHIGSSLDQWLSESDGETSFSSPRAQSRHIQRTTAIFAMIKNVIEIVIAAVRYREYEIGDYAVCAIIQERHAIIQLRAQDQPMIRIVVHAIPRSLTNAKY